MASAKSSSGRARAFPALYGIWMLAWINAGSWEIAHAERTDASKPWLVQTYQTLLRERPLMTKSLTAAVLMSASDAISQRIENHAMESSKRRKSSLSLEKAALKSQNTSSALTSRRINYNWRRTLEVSVTGFTWSAPAAHCWHNILDWLVQSNSRWTGLLIRLLLDATIFAPFSCKFCATSSLRACHGPIPKFNFFSHPWRQWPFILPGEQSSKESLLQRRSTS
jgi:hypothetical protein